MEIALIILAVAVVIVAAVVVWVVLRREDTASAEADQRVEQLIAAQVRSQENLSGQLKMLNDQQNAAAAAANKALQESSERLTKSMNERLLKAKATFLIDYKGLDVEAMNSLRTKLRGVDAELQVVMNRLLKLACRETESATLSEHLVGPCALAVSYEDAVAPAKVLVEQSKGSDHLTVKAGQISGKMIEAAGIKRLSALPSREALLGQALAAMQAVPSSLARLLNNVVVGLVNALKAIETQKSEGTSPEE